MAELDSLLGSQIQLISNKDIKYVGELYSIDKDNSTIILKDVLSLGTGTGVDQASFVPEAKDKIPFVSFPGTDIKDLTVLANEDKKDKSSSSNNKSNKSNGNKSLSSGNQLNRSSNNNNNNSRNNNSDNNYKQNGSGRGGGRGSDRDNRNGGGRGGRGSSNSNSWSNNNNSNNNRNNNSNNNNTKSDKPSAAIGSGAHLMNVKTRGGDGVTIMEGEFDFQKGLSVFKKDEIESDAVDVNAAYAKDDFFDNLSSDQSDRNEGRRTRMSAQEERSVNLDTFGATSLQMNRRGGRGGRGRYRGRGYRGGGRGSGRGGGRS